MVHAIAVMHRHLFSVRLLQVHEHREVLDVARKQLATSDNRGRCNGEVRTINCVMARPPFSTQFSGAFRNQSINWVPNENRKKGPSSSFFLGPHSREHFETSDFTGVQRGRQSLVLEDIMRSRVTAEVINDYRRVDENRH